MRVLFIGFFIASLSMLASAKGNGPQHPDQVVKKAVIAESIAAYPGKCPCPFNVARNGSSCGARSAWSKQGGYAPICYEREVTTDMVSKWRAEHRDISAATPPSKHSRK
jgi:endogenous inhibitor of DNA gyrase (YacG/DUF329 family)